jgi:hypothetical protein
MSEQTDAPVNSHVIVVDAMPGDDEITVECHACGETLDVTSSALPFDVLHEMVVEHLADCTPPDLSYLQAELDEMERADPKLAAAARRVNEAAAALATGEPAEPEPHTSASLAAGSSRRPEDRDGARKGEAEPLSRDESAACDAPPEGDQP